MGMLDSFSLDNYPRVFVHSKIGEYVFIKCKGNREICGNLHAFDSHLNILVGNVRETIKSIVLDKKNLNEKSDNRYKTYPFLFIRGDRVTFLNLFQEIQKPSRF